MKNIFSKEEIDFLKNHDILHDEIFDARGKSTYFWKNYCRQNGIFFIIGSPCKRNSHRIRSRANFCIQCDTSKISYMRRHYRPAQVYLAWSPSAKLCKIGVADNARQRGQTLRSQAYGGCLDWAIKLAVRTDSAGELEQRIHSALRPYSTKICYPKGGRNQDAKEIFNCDIYVAAKTLIRESNIRNQMHFSRWRDMEIRRMVLEYHNNL